MAADDFAYRGLFLACLFLPTRIGAYRSAWGRREMGLWAIAAARKGGLYCLFCRYVRYQLLETRGRLADSHQDPLRTHLSKPSFSLAHAIANFSSLITPRRHFRVRSRPPLPSRSRSASFIRRRTCRPPRTNPIFGTREAFRSAPTSNRTGSQDSTLTQQEITRRYTRLSRSCV